MDKTKIEKEAKQILDKFSKAIEGVKFKETESKGEVGGFRKEGEGKQCDADFRDAMFKNAPKKEGDCIVAEKKSW